MYERAWFSLAKKTDVAYWLISYKYFRLLKFRAVCALPLVWSCLQNQLDPKYYLSMLSLTTVLKRTILTDWFSGCLVWQAVKSLFAYHEKHWPWKRYWMNTKWWLKVSVAKETNVRIWQEIMWKRKSCTSDKLKPLLQ